VSSPATPAARRGLTLLLGAGVLWGTGGIAGHLLQADAGLSAPAVAAYRLLVGGALIAAVAAATGRLRALRRPTGPVVRRLAANAALHAVFQLL
jgi:DME family drug/metabolite transporter